MVPYFLTGISVLIAAILHWLAPQNFWRATAMSTAVILLVSLASLYIFNASGMLVSEDTGETPDFSGRLGMISLLISFFAMLISLFVGWFIRIIRQ